MERGHPGRETFCAKAQGGRSKPRAFRKGKVGWFGSGESGDGSEGEVMMARLSCWGFLLRAVGSHGGVLNRERMASDVGVQK